MTNKLLMIGAAVMTTLLALVVVWQFHTAVIYVLISLTLAAVLRPLASRLAGRRILVRAAWMLLYLAALASFGFLLFLISEAAVYEIQHFAQSISVQDTWKLPVWLEGSVIQQTLVAWLPAPSKLFDAITGNQGQLVLPAILGFTSGISDVVSGTIVIVLMSLYWIGSQTHFERLWLSLLPSGQRSQARHIWRTIEPDLGAYIRSQLIHSLLAGVLLGLGYWAIGSPYPVLLALVGALTCLIPVVGSALALVAVLIVGLLTGVQLSLFTVLFTLIVLIALSVWIRPILFNRRWDNPILTLVLLIALANAFGLVGIILAPPVSAVCQIIWNLLVSHRLAEGAAAQVSDLKERLGSVWVTIKAMEESPLPLVTSSMEKLTALMEKAEPLLQADTPVEPSILAYEIAPLPEQKGHNDRTQIG